MKLRKKFVEFVEFLGSNEVLYTIRDDRQNVEQYSRYCARLIGTRRSFERKISKKEYEEKKKLGTISTIN